MHGLLKRCTSLSVLILGIDFDCFLGFVAPPPPLARSHRAKTEGETHTHIDIDADRTEKDIRATEPCVRREQVQSTDKNDQRARRQVLRTKRAARANHEHPTHPVQSDLLFLSPPRGSRPLPPVDDDD